LKRPLNELIQEKAESLFGREARVARISPLAGDASSRRYHRAFLEGPSAPSSVVVMELGGNSLPLSSEELAVFKEPLKELPFLNLHRFLKTLGVKIPALYGCWIDEGILVLEDLGDCSLWERVQGLPVSDVILWYQKAIDQLLLIQINGTLNRDERCIAFQQRFDFRLYMWEFDHFIEYGLEKRTRNGLTHAEKAFLTQSFVEIARRLENQPPCLNHRDFHSWNLMVHQDEIVVIDFQDALLAPPQYDLASLLNDRETDRLISPEVENRLVDYYLERRARMEGRQLSGEEFFENYLLSVLQRDFKVVGRFYYLDQVKGKAGYKKYIPPTLRRLKRTLERLPGPRRLIPVLAEHFEEMQ